MKRLRKVLVGIAGSCAVCVVGLSLSAFMASASLAQTTSPGTCAGDGSCNSNCSVIGQPGNETCQQRNDPCLKGGSSNCSACSCTANPGQAGKIVQCYCK